MTPQQWLRVKETFARASALEPSAQQQYLREACAADTALRAEVESLLRAHATADAILDHPVAAYVPLSGPEGGDDRWVGRRVGAYELVACLGRGGMGEVFRARRADAEYEKEVAIKLVRVGYDTAFVLQRFRAERQILAHLEHPNIARLLDGGVTEEGQPYLVMELIEGQPIDQYCELKALSLPSRLRLFREACAAVSYAHQRLVVHRDLKPSNILVTAQGSIRLLDFGIAKLLQAPAETAPADATRTGMQALTPAFSSPEQILGLHITTASDVYSLGVVLFHLLTGRSPYRNPLASTKDAIQEVCETEPLRPSVAAQAPGARGPPVLPDRDLDAITLRALRKEPEKRYSSVEQFSEDLRRYLGGLPVIARGDQFSYRAAKFLRRHRVQVAAAAAVAAALIVGIVVTTREARIADAQRARAERHFASVRKLASDFMFRMHDSIRDLPEATAARALLAKTALGYLDGLAQEAGSDRHLQLELAQAYTKVADVEGEVGGANTGDPKIALLSYAKAIALLRLLATGAPADADITSQLASVQLKHARLLAVSGEVPAGKAESQQAVASLQALVASQPANPGARDALAMAYTSDADTLSLAGDPAAISSADQAIAILEGLHGVKPDDLTYSFHLATAYNRAGYVAQIRGDERTAIARAIELNQKAIALIEQVIAADPQHERHYWTLLATGQADLGVQFYDRGDYERALEYYRQAEGTFSRLAVDRNNWQAQFDVANLKVQVGSALERLGSLDAAEAKLREAEGLLLQTAQRGDTLSLQFVLAFCEKLLGTVHERWAADPRAERSVQLLHWREASRWFNSSVERFQRVTAGGITLFPMDRTEAEEAAAGLARSSAEIARLKGVLEADARLAHAPDHP